MRIKQREIQRSRRRQNPGMDRGFRGAKPGAAALNFKWTV